VLTTQLALPADVSAHVYNNAKGYEGSRNPFSHVSIAGDVSWICYCSGTTSLEPSAKTIICGEKAILILSKFVAAK